MAFTYLDDEAPLALLPLSRSTSSFHILSRGRKRWREMRSSASGRKRTTTSGGRGR